ncbi:PaaI family thioesterase [Gymnodinialimonas hymeniacidonis]|uniref:PaaI family thioesterase n=1 Tax=Gymnodinialimonas hymeniacidonis TaxID=3126508 RepID=UPI0034C63F76
MHKISSLISQQIQDSFARQGMMQSLGAQIERIASGEVVLSLRPNPEMSQQHGVVHAGATFALGDSASGYAALTQMPAGKEVMTVEMKINLLDPAAGARLIATGRVVKPGKRLVITRCDIEAEAEDGTRKLVAILQGTMIPVEAT